MRETDIREIDLRHLVVELPVGHPSCVTVDDLEVRRGDVIGGGVAVSGRSIEDEAPASRVPFLHFVLLLGVLFLEVV